MGITEPETTLAEPERRGRECQFPTLSFTSSQYSLQATIAC